MTDNKRGMSVGVISLLVIFSVLCLAIFSVLSLSTALNERNLAERSAKATSDYYAAELRCAEIVAQLRSGDSPEGIPIMEGGGLLSFSQPIDAAQILQVQLDADTLEITCWRVIYTADWSPDTGISVWDGE